MRILNLLDHLLVDIFNDHLVAGCRVRDGLASARLAFWLFLVGPDIGVILVTLLALLLQLLLYLPVPLFLVEVQVIEELPHGRDLVLA